MADIDADGGGAEARMSSSILIDDRDDSARVCRSRKSKIVASLMSASSSSTEVDVVAVERDTTDGRSDAGSRDRMNEIGEDDGEG
jgi:hypothetical protein